MEDLKKCPFCGKDFRIVPCDDEGNFRDEFYEEDPWGGIHYVLVHNEEDAEENCPIATFVGQNIGTYMYDTEEEAIAACNMRKG